MPLLGETQEDDRRLITELVMQKLVALEVAGSSSSISSNKFAPVSVPEARSSTSSSISTSNSVAAPTSAFGYTSASATSSAVSLQS